MESNGKLTKRISVRATDDQIKRLEDVAENIAAESRGGRRPDISEIVRSILGWDNHTLVSVMEREYIAGNIAAIHGSFPPGPSLASSIDKSQARVTFWQNAGAASNNMTNSITMCFTLFLPYSRQAECRRWPYSIERVSAGPDIWPRRK